MNENPETENTDGQSKPHSGRAFPWHPTQPIPTNTADNKPVSPPLLNNYYEGPHMSNVQPMAAEKVEQIQPASTSVEPAVNPSDSPLANQAPAPPKQQHGWVIPVIVGVSLLMVLLVASAVILAYISYKQSPSRIFAAALQNNLAIPRLSEQITTTGLTATRTYDLSVTNKPSLTMSANLQLDGSTFSLKGYGSLSDTYITYTKLPSTTPTATSNAILNKWIQLRKQGKLADGISAPLANITDPHTQLLGPLAIGNFSLQERKTLVQYLLNHGVYTYTAKQVNKTILNGHTVLVYPLKVNASALENFYNTIASSEGLSTNDVKQVYSAQLAKPLSITAYVTTDNFQFVRLDYQAQGYPVTINYSRASSQSMTQPKADLSWQQFAPQQVALENQAALLESNSQLDSARVNRINELQFYIEKYHINTGGYPSLANLNDQVWISAHMQGINPDAFKDPQGSGFQLSLLPAAGVYAYQPLSLNGAACNNDPNARPNVPCATYKLIATLSNRQQYGVENIH